jgi:3-hydroxyisobutyrate dehydrogenase
VPVRVGFVGLGNIGLPMARNVARAGFALTVFDLDPAPGAVLAADGAALAPSLAHVGRECDLIGICVRDDREVEQALLGDDGLVPAARPGTIVAVHSTIRPRTVVALAAAAARHGVHVLDVPVAGGAQGAAARTLCYMAGGEAALVEQCRRVFASSASTIVLTGPVGSGMRTKLCNNLLTYLGFLAAHEAMRLAAAAGLARDTVLAATQATGVMTGSMRAYLDARGRFDADAHDATLRRQFEKFADLGEKDLGIALEVADELGLSLPAAALCRQLVADVYGVGGDRRPACS